MDRVILSKFAMALEALASDERDKHMNAAEMRVFLLVAVRPNVSQMLLASEIGISQSEISRIMVKFQDMNGTGYGLLKAEENPAYRKEKLVTLTPSGKRLATRIVALLN